MISIRTVKTVNFVVLTLSQFGQDHWKRKHLSRISQCKILTDSLGGKLIPLHHGEQDHSIDLFVWTFVVHILVCGDGDLFFAVGHQQK